MAIYILLYVIVMGMGLYSNQKHYNKHSKRVLLFVSFSLMTIVLGLRGITVGEDTSHYINVFNQAVNVSWSDIIHSNGFHTAYFTNQFGYTDTIENGFLVVCKIIHWITDNPQVFLFIIACITNILFAKFIYDNCDDVFFSTYIFLTESMFMLSFNGIRQLLAVAITLQAYTLIKKRKIKTALFLVVVAALFHVAALVALLAFPILLVKPNKEYRKFKYAIIAAIGIPLAIVIFRDVITRFVPRYTGYFLNNYWVNSLGGITVLWIVEFILILYMYKKKFVVDDSFGMSSLTLLYLTFELLGLQISAFSRIGWFFRPYLMMFFPIALSYFKKKNARYIRWFLVLLLTLLYLSYASTPAREYAFFW